MYNTASIGLFWKKFEVVEIRHIGSVVVVDVDGNEFSKKNNKTK